MPASGARSGTKPSRLDRGAGDGTIGRTALTCGHTTDEPAVATGKAFALYHCPRGCGLTRRATTRPTKGGAS